MDEQKNDLTVNGEENDFDDSVNVDSNESEDFDSLKEHHHSSGGSHHHHHHSSDDSDHSSDESHHHHHHHHSSSGSDHSSDESHHHHHHHSSDGSDHSSDESHHHHHHHSSSGSDHSSDESHHHHHSSDDSGDKTVSNEDLNDASENPEEKHHSHSSHSSRHNHSSDKSTNSTKSKYIRKIKKLLRKKKVVYPSIVAIVLIIALVIVLIVKCPSSSDVVRSELLFDRSTQMGDKYICPVDFDKLKSINPDIYAWLDIPGSNISYPVVNHPGNNSYYLDHNSDDNWDGKGAIFSEDYNSRDFTDPVVELFGHHMRNHTMFADLEQTFSNEEFFNNHKDINIYLPERMINYKLFAATPYSSIHILRNYDFHSEYVYNSFFNSVFNSRGMGALIDKSVKLDWKKDHVLILSTCLSGNNMNRYLVFAVENSTINK